MEVANEKDQVLGSDYYCHATWGGVRVISNWGKPSHKKTILAGGKGRKHRLRPHGPGIGN